MRVGISLAMMLACSAFAQTSGLQATVKTVDELTKMSLEELMDIEITSVSKKQQKLSEAAAAVFVITREDIRRSGASSIPEALRMVPGLQVARIDANKWAITSRGFNGRFANKLLVLMDGRSVYTPLFSGVFWEVQDTLLADIERIEVIRGPGAALWGANAVNGVINIITQTARDTQGGLVTGGAGTEDRGFGAVRYGGTAGENGHYRIYAKYLDRDAAGEVDGHATADDWHMLRAGFRGDWVLGLRDDLTVQGDIYAGEAGQTVTVPSLTDPFRLTFEDDIDLSGGNLLGRWRHSVAETSNLVLQLYYDRTHRKEMIFKETRDTFDIDFQHQFHWGKQNELLWGLGYRLTQDDTTGSFSASLTPDRRSDHLFSAFFQDELTLVPERLRLILGTKLEHNDYTGFEIQPNLRLIWTSDARSSLWASVARAVRTPSRAEADGRSNIETFAPGALFPFSPVAVAAGVGSDEAAAEELIAYELGYRIRPLDRLSLDLALFFNDYDHLSNLTAGRLALERAPAPPHLVIPFFVSNLREGETYGVELAADWWVSDWWRLQAAYSYLEMRLRTQAGGEDPGQDGFEGRSPMHQVSLRSSMDLGAGLELDLWARYVDDLPGQNLADYLTMDARLGWKPHSRFEVALVGQNLFSKQHPEFSYTDVIDTLPTEVERSVYGEVTWRF